MGPLEGVKVVDLSVMMSGPLAAMMLADQGAEVVKVEAPGLGDMMRHFGSRKGGETGIFVTNNRGKRSLVVDMKHPDGVALLHELVADADVLIQNFRPGAVERLGIGYEDLRQLNPRLIYVSISGYGPDGPFSHRRVYDNVIQAASGLASVQTDPATGKPSLFRTLVCDKVTAYTAAQAITAALYARAMGKAEGQHIVLAMLDAAIAFTWPDVAMDAALLDDDVTRTPTIGSAYVPTRLVDGYITSGAVTESEFRGLCAAYGHPEVADDPRFRTIMDRMANAKELNALWREYADHVTVEEFLSGADEFEVPASRFNEISDLADDPQVRHNEVFVERTHRNAGRIREARPAARFSDTDTGIGRLAPSFGEPATRSQPSSASTPLRSAPPASSTDRSRARQPPVMARPTISLMISLVPP